MRRAAKRITAASVPKARSPFPSRKAGAATAGRNTSITKTWKSYGGPASGINSLVIRYADVLLMFAETYIQEDNAEAARPFINQVRGRVGAFQYTTPGNKANATTILMRERQLELSGEQSRYFDLLRWGVIRTVLNAELKAQYGAETFQDKHLLLPIPQQEKDTNPNVANDVAKSRN